MTRNPDAAMPAAGNTRPRPGHGASPAVASDAAGLLDEIRAYRAWRCHRDDVFRNYFQAVQHWQVELLARRHRRFLDDPRYAPVTRFFLEDMYALDLGCLADEAERALPIATRIMPRAALHAAAVALRLNSLTGQLDERVAEILFEEMAVRKITPESYAQAYRDASTRELRHQQLTLLRELGGDLDRHVRSRVIYGTFRLASRPAQLAGLGGLYGFLDRGFSVMRPMDSARQYICQFTDVEHKIVDNLFDHHPDPFNVDVPPLA